MKARVALIVSILCVTAAIVGAQQTAEVEAEKLGKVTQPVVAPTFGPQGLQLAYLDRVPYFLQKGDEPW